MSANSADILVTGAAGMTGRLLIPWLGKRGLTVRAMARSEEHAALLQGLGADQIVPGDLGDFDSLVEAMQSVSIVHHIPPMMRPDEVQYGNNAIQAACDSGVKLFSYHSVLHPMLRGMSHHAAKQDVEEALVLSGLPHVIFQPGQYMQNYLGMLDSMRSQGIMPITWNPQQKMGVVDAGDFSEAIANVLADPQPHIDAIYPLCGPEALTGDEMANIWSSCLKKPVEAVRVPTDQLQSGLQAAGWPEERIEIMQRMRSFYDQHGLPNGNSKVLEHLLTRPPRSYRQFAEETFKSTGNL
ncbi:MAG: SDR family oxidoreductase [Pseudomonadales bacterium]